MTTREKLAACLGKHFHQSAYAGRTLDALEAIVREARNETIEECAKRFDGMVMVIESKFNGARHECDMDAAAKMLRALKVSK